MKQTLSPVSLLLATLALADMPKEPELVAVTHHKEIVKRDRKPKQIKPGRGKPAKGYDPVTRTWHK